MNASSTGIINFSGDRDDGGCWSNTDPTLSRQAFSPREVDIYDASKLKRPPSLYVEGFSRQRMPLQGVAWDDGEWVEHVYLPAAAAIVKDLCGAAHAEPFVGGAMIRDSRTAEHAPPATFPHLDFSRQSLHPFLQISGMQEVRAAYPRVKIFNVWRSITEPPQNPALALCDQQTVDESDWVIGRTLGEGDVDDVEYVTLGFNPNQRWYFFPDLMLDEVLVFKSGDSDSEALMGCFHTALSRRDLNGGGIPRASIEMRVAAFFPK